MARGRIISTQVASDQQLNNLSPEAERLYLRTLPHLDRDGLVTGHPMLLWAKVAPLRMELMDKCNALIQEWVQHGLVISYPGADGMPVLHFKGFRRHNANIPYTQEAPSIYPPPPGHVRGTYGLIPEDEEARFRLAACFDKRSDYRKELEGQKAPVTDADKVPTRSRPGCDKVEYQDHDHDQGQFQRNDPDDDHSLMTPSHVGYSNRRYVDLSAALAETPDDEIRVALEFEAERYGVTDTFTGWARTVAGWNREELIIALATMKSWEDDALLAKVKTRAGYLHGAVRSRTLPKLTHAQIADLPDDIADAMTLLDLPAAEQNDRYLALVEERTRHRAYDMARIQEEL